MSSQDNQMRNRQRDFNHTHIAQRPCCIRPSRSSGGVVVKLLAYEARGPEFDSQSCHYHDFRDWLSADSKSRYG